MDDFLLYKLNQQFKIQELRDRSSQHDQRSDGWKDERNNYITGSIIAHAIGLMGNQAKQDLILEKSTMGKCRNFYGNHTTHFGNIMEPISNMIYCLRYGTNINMFNQIKHPTINFLAVSTDGVTDELVNIEFKSLYSREIRQNYIKKEYYHQMQLQMECLNLYTTHFIEVKYDVIETCNQIDINGKSYQYQFSNPIQVNQDNDSISVDLEHGIIIETWNAITNDYEYFYSEITVDQYIQSWYDETMLFIQKSHDLTYIRDIYWTLNTFYVQQVLRDPKWIHTYLPGLKTFWDQVLYYRDPKNAIELNQLILNKNSKKNSRSNKSMDECLL